MDAQQFLRCSFDFVDFHGMFETKATIQKHETYKVLESFHFTQNTIGETYSTIWQEGGGKGRERERKNETNLKKQKKKKLNGGVKKKMKSNKEML